jgi:hypothetical protein
MATWQFAVHSFRPQQVSLTLISLLSIPHLTFTLYAQSPIILHFNSDFLLENLHDSKMSKYNKVIVVGGGLAGMFYHHNNIDI